jgi:glutaredoxin
LNNVLADLSHVDEQRSFSMSFQFQCPNGHLLEADESQSGQTCTCPHCSISIVIPASPASASQPSTVPTPPPAPEAVSGVPEIYPEFDAGNVGRTTKSVTINPDDEAAEKLLHIPCPKGHILDTPLDMLGEDVLCPHCETQFRLLERNSVEFQRKNELEERRKEARANKFWLNFAIIAAVVFVLGLLIMIIASSG